MSSGAQMFRSLTIAIALGFLARHASAQEPVLRPLTEHIASVKQDSVGVLRYVGRRCAALYTIAADLASDGSPAITSQLRTLIPPFVAMSIAADRALGAASEQAAIGYTQRGIEAIVIVYRERMYRNMALTGSYFADDSLVAADLSVCGELATMSK